MKRHRAHRVGRSTALRIAEKFYRVRDARAVRHEVVNHEQAFRKIVGTKMLVKRCPFIKEKEGEHCMRKIVLALASVAAFGLAIPVVSSPADAREVVIIKKKRHHWDRGHHYGWYKGRHYGWDRHHRRHGARVVIR
jgi:hypothetical protein